MSGPASGATTKVTAASQTQTNPQSPPSPAGRIVTPPGVAIRAVYITGVMAGSPKGKVIAESWRDHGGNAVVFDAQDNDGPVVYASKLALASHLKHPYISDLSAWIAWLHEHGLYTIARMAVFKDERLITEHPELGVHSRTTGGLWLENGRAAWSDPSQLAVQDYKIALAKEVADAGVDEIQFDYIRFPVDGNQKDAVFAYQATAPETPRQDFISNFLFRAQHALHPTGVHIGIDVYGVTAWARDVDVNATGQDVISLAYYCDVMCPMIYPSHFFGNFDGYADPGDAPEHFIQAGMQKFNAITQDTGVSIRPWLQAFAWRTKTFGPEYIETQVATAHANSADGFMLWNAGNNYTAPETAMPVMLADSSKYFDVNYPYAVQTTPAATAPTLSHQ